MKILALADLHAEESVLDRLRVISTKGEYDHILIAGDITNRGPISYAEEVVELLGNERLFAVHGNMDPPPVLELLEEKGVSVHGKKKSIGEWNIVGFGGSNPTPFNTPSEMSEEDIEKGVDRLKLDGFSIFLTHVPPYGVMDTVGGTHIGSRAIRNVIERRKPLLNVCGHVHEQEGQSVLGETLVVQLKPAMHLRAAEIRIEEDIKVSFIEL
jgi:Icc-related predicted phosphoesterase